MNFLIKQTPEFDDNAKKKEYIEITNDKQCLNLLNSYTGEKLIRISFHTLLLDRKLYGINKSNTLSIQKANCRDFLKFYKVFKKAIKKLLKSKKFSGEIYVDRLSEKKNNNDLMLSAMLSVDFNAKFFDKMKVAYEGACDFFDAENSLNKMCDFHDNHCTKHRDKGIDKITGCCPSFCKIRVPGAPCAHKNLACKIFMCDYLIHEKGYYFTPNTVPVLKKHMTVLERATCFGSLCRTEKKSLKNLWLFRIQTTLYFILLIIVILFLFFSF